ncbi:MAG TPA: type II CAAX endopeptidase family protein [Chloroflexota bacterium]|nr:type II CAAX endopeptidase family protein [Chloroflexota bacterium]
MSHLDLATARIVSAPAAALDHTRAPRDASLARVWRFTALAFGITWLIWWTAALAARGLIVVPAPLGLLSILGGVGPSLAAVVLTAREAGGPGVRALLGRAVTWRAHPGWYAVVLLGPFALHGTAMGLHVLLGGQPPDPAQLIGSLPGVLVSLVPVFLLFGPLGEEFGWRGYALPRLQARFGALAASLLVGVAWAAWHTPLFFDPTSSYAQLPPMVFVARMVGLAVLFTWLVNRTGGSLLFPLLAHTVINASGQIWAAVPDPGTDAYQEQLLTAAVWAAALLVIAIGGLDLGQRTAVALDRVRRTRRPARSLGDA